MAPRQARGANAASLRRKRFKPAADSPANGDNPADRTGPIAKKFFLSDKNFTQLRAFMASDPCACGRAFPYKLIE